MNNLSTTVKMLRKQYNLTQEELSLKSGVGLRFVRDLEQGKETLRLDKVNQLLDRSREIIHKHPTLYLFGYKVNINISHYTTKGIIYFIISIIIPDKV